MAKQQTVKMRLRGAWDLGLRWEACVGKRWIGPHDYFAGSERDRVRSAKRSGNAWAKRMNLKPEWE